MGEKFWDEWRGQEGKPTMLIKRLARLGGWRLDLHKFVGPDLPECFHTHPSYALRIVLRGGYVEETLARFRHLRPFFMGIVPPDYCHRIDALPNGASYSLWLRAPVQCDVKLIGDGWPAADLEGAAQDPRRRN